MSLNLKTSLIILLYWVLAIFAICYFIRNELFAWHFTNQYQIWITALVAVVIVSMLIRLLQKVGELILKRSANRADYETYKKKIKPTNFSWIPLRVAMFTIPFMVLWMIFTKTEPHWGFILPILLIPIIIGIGFGLFSKWFSKIWK